MELRHLRYFLAVGEASNFTKAAAQLRVAQPALSRQVQDLEDEIDVELMRRSPRGVTLTAEGRLFLEEVRELLKRSDESVEKVAHWFVANMVSCALATRQFRRWRYCRQRSQRFANPCRARGYCCMTSQTMNSSPDYEMARWTSRSWPNSTARRPQALSLNCYAPTRCVSR
ncbi:MAG: hypothetical protein QOH31_611 [Verrucomicrobiota bacterium]